MRERAADTVYDGNAARGASLGRRRPGMRGFGATLVGAADPGDLVRSTGAECGCIGPTRWREPNG